MLASKLLRGKTSATNDHDQKSGFTARIIAAIAAAKRERLKRNAVRKTTPTVRALHTAAKRLTRNGIGPSGSRLNRCPNIVNSG